MAKIETEFVSAILAWLEDTTWKIISVLEMAVWINCEMSEFPTKKKPEKSF